jgi:phage-related minor tail protein
MLANLHPGRVASGSAGDPTSFGPGGNTLNLPVGSEIDMTGIATGSTITGGRFLNSGGSSGGGRSGGGSAVEEFLTLFPELERQMEQHNETVEKARANYNLLEDAYDSGLISQEEYKQKMLEVEAQYGPLGKALEEVGNLAKSISETVGSELNSAFSDVLRGTKTVGEALRDFAQNVLISIAEELFNKMITQPLVSSLGNALSGISLFSANGNAFNPSGVVPFANGGVVSSPQLFAFGNGGSLGVMGEAGPEAILPLARGPGGKLGVRSSGGGSPVNVVVNNYSNEQAEVKQNGQNLEVIIGRVVSRDIQNGGPTYRAMRKTFGLRQPTVQRG